MRNFKKYQVAEEKCDLCGIDPIRTADSKICNECHGALERFFLLYFSSRRLRERLPNEVIVMLRDTVRQILESYPLSEYHDHYFKQVLLSQGMKAKVHHKTAAAAAK